MSNEVLERLVNEDASVVAMEVVVAAARKNAEEWQREWDDITTIDDFPDHDRVSFAEHSIQADEDLERALNNLQAVREARH